jgi:hypothetical protein
MVTVAAMIDTNKNNDGMLRMKNSAVIDALRMRFWSSSFRVWKWRAKSEDLFSSSLYMFMPET